MFLSTVCGLVCAWCSLFGILLVSLSGVSFILSVWLVDLRSQSWRYIANVYNFFPSQCSIACLVFLLVLGVPLVFGQRSCLCLIFPLSMFAVLVFCQQIWVSYQGLESCWYSNLMVSCQDLWSLSYLVFCQSFYILAFALYSTSGWSGILFVLDVPAVSGYCKFSLSCWTQHGLKADGDRCYIVKMAILVLATILITALTLLHLRALLWKRWASYFFLRSP